MAVKSSAQIHFLQTAKINLFLYKIKCLLARDSFLERQKATSDCSLANRHYAKYMDIPANKDERYEY